MAKVNVSAKGVAAAFLFFHTMNGKTTATTIYLIAFYTPL